MSSTHGNDSRGPRTYCEPHDGARSPNFLAFKRNFKTGSSAHFLSEDDYSIWQACQDSDQGGNAAGADPCLRNKVEMFLVGTEIMMADIYTKALDKTKFLKCRDYLLRAA